MSNPYICPVCESKNVKEIEYTDTFNYRIGDENVQLTANYPVESCQDCNFVSSGQEAEIARDKAVRNYLKVLLPEEIKSIREKYGLNRQAFADLTGIGIASLNRWEKGELIQNKSNDNLLRFLSVERNFLALKSRDDIRSLTESRKTLPKMRALTGEDIEVALKSGANFQLTIKHTSMACTQ